MNKLFRFNFTYFILTILLFATEIIIAVFIHDTIIRPYIGDLLVVILIYCFIRSFLNTPVLPTAIGVLLFSFVIETAQYFNIVHVLGLQEYRWAKIIIGSSFAWGDIACYISGIVLVVFIEKVLTPKNNVTSPKKIENV
jgi:hypothetical protein